MAVNSFLTMIFLTLRHNNIGQFTEELLKELCHDVKVELLLQLTQKRLSGNTTDGARVTNRWCASLHIFKGDFRKLVRNHFTI